MVTGKHQSQSEANRKLMKKGEKMKAEVKVQLRGGGALTRSAGSRCVRRKVKGHLLEAGRSLAAFVCGLLLACAYGAAALFLQQQPLWVSAYGSLAVACMAAFGMGLSASIRADVMVTLPSLCSAHGRNFLLLLSVSLLLAAPLSNTLRNTERAASSLLCGAELTANQTQELLQRAATPLFSVLDRLSEISSNAVAVAGRVHNLVHALTDSVRHIARILRNVLHFLVDIGDVCNAKLGSPYRKCRAVFAEARADCSDLLGDFNFLCDIITGFLPLCQLARVGELFCIIPSFIGRHLRTRLADPTVAAFERLKREFDFNISASVTFDLDANSSRSLQQVTQDIMEEVTSELQVFRTLSELLAYGSLVLLTCSFLRARRYRKRYLSEVDFDNVYISAAFQEFDQQLTSGGGASVLPITRREAKTYITPLAWRLTNRERRAVLVGVSSVLRHTVMGGLLVVLDFLVFWMLDQVQHQVKEDVVARAPVTVAVRVNGSGYASDIFRDLVASFNVLQGGNVTVISRKCLLPPSEPDQSACFILGLVLGLALLVSLSSGFMQRCRRLVCSSVHPHREQERIQFLHQLILDQRTAVGKALRRSAARSRGGGGGGRGGLQTLLLWLPGVRHLCDLLGLSPVSCLACAEGAGPEEDTMVTCDAPQCPGVFCRPCFHSLGNTCVVCVRPLTFQQEEELDSSDDEQQSPNSENITEPSSWSLMKKRVSTATHRRHSDGQMTAKDGDSEISEADVTDQDRLRSDESTSSAPFDCLQSQFLTTVLVQRPDSSTATRTLQDSPGASRTLQDQD